MSGLGQRRDWIFETLYRATRQRLADRGPAVLASPDVPDRSVQPPRANHVIDDSFVRQHVRRRNGDTGIFLALADRNPGDIRGIAYRSVADSDIHSCAARLRVSGRGDGA